jgi:hypothetical protein
MFVIVENKSLCLNILLQNICNLEKLKPAFATGEYMLVMRSFLGGYEEVT